MQKVTSTSEQVALNAAPTEIKSRFGTYEISWDKVTRPAGDSIVSRVAHAVIEAVKNLAKHVYNAAVWAPNKIHSLLYPNAANAVAAPAANDDEIIIQQDSVIVSIYDASQEADQVQAESELPQPSIIEVEEELPEPAVANNRTWLKAALVGGLAAGATAGLMVAASRYDVKVPYFGTDVPGAKTVDTFLTATIPGKAQAAKEGMQSMWASMWTKNCDQTLVDGWKKEDAFTTLACDTAKDAKCLDSLQATFLSQKAAAASCKV